MGFNTIQYDDEITTAFNLEALESSEIRPEFLENRTPGAKGRALVPMPPGSETKNILFVEHGKDKIAAYRTNELSLIPQSPYTVKNFLHLLFH
ncbi:MAG: hypothetical protein K9G62_02305 [Alphaproteobacteria bacterium]|nr:hypothetical protein [Alphaproteobacteria bacterium]